MDTAEHDQPIWTTDGSEMQPVTCLAYTLPLLTLLECTIMYGLPISLIRRLRSVQNAAAQLIFDIRRSEHITLAVLRSSAFIGCVSLSAFPLNYHRAIQGARPRYLHSRFTPVADMPLRWRLRSSCSDRLHVPLVRLSTVGSRTFSVSGAAVWNDLPAHVTSAPSLACFQAAL